MMTSAAPPDAPAGSTGSMGRFALSSSSSIHDEAGDSDKQQHAALLKRPVAVSNGLDSRNQHLGADVDDDTMVDVDVSQAADEAVVDDEMDTSDRDDADALVQSDAPTTTTGDTAASFVPDDDDASAGSSGDMRRVKVYLLEDGEWIDRGTGHVGLIPAGDNPCARGHTATLRVERETPPFDTVLETLVYDHSDFQKQDGTLIVWTEADKTDWAVSFAQAGGCGEIWEILQGFCNGIDQDADPLEGLEGGSDTGHSSDDMLDDTPDTPSTVGYHSRSSSVGGSRNGSGVAPLLEEPGTGNVRAIRDTLERIRTRRYPIPAHQLLTFLRTSVYFYCHW
ncbi:hypothetical protein BC828DRAFT_125568 [Blastocladiella britannica]|nr:hypothetical protein BC828DRAFT_125568 [Blastocladiella britannica]